MARLFGVVSGTSRLSEVGSHFGVRQPGLVRPRAGAGSTVRELVLMVGIGQGPGDQTGGGVGPQGRACGLGEGGPGRTVARWRRTVRALRANVAGRRERR